MIFSDRKRDLRYPRSSCDQSRDTCDSSLINGDQHFPHTPREHPPHEHSVIRFSGDTASFSAGRHVTIANNLSPPTNDTPSPCPQQKSILKKQTRPEEDTLLEEKARLNLKLVDLPTATKNAPQENYSPR